MYIDYCAHFVFCAYNSNRFVLSVFLTPFSKKLQAQFIYYLLIYLGRAKLFIEGPYIYLFPSHIAG